MQLIALHAHKNKSHHVALALKKIRRECDLFTFQRELIVRNFLSSNTLLTTTKSKV